MLRWTPTVAVAVVLFAWAAMAVGAPNDDEESTDPDYAAGKAAIAAKDWNAAIKSLSSAALRDTRNADIQNHLGYAYRNSGQLDLAFQHYSRALQLNPRHRGAHEYAGEAYLLAGNLAKAEEHLAALRRICVIPCEEYADLEKAVADYRARGR
jgi:Flp pilus assembly protein TadD